MVTEQIMKTLVGLIPEDTAKEIEAGFNAILESAEAKIQEAKEKEYNEKLTEAYAIVEKEKAEIEAIAEKGYGQALEMIQTLEKKLDTQKAELETSLKEGYEEAYQMILEERAKNDALEVKLHEEYETRFKDSYNALVEKIDQYLSIEGEKYNESVKTFMLNDPELNEKKLALDKILEVAQDYITDEDFANVTSSKIEVVTKQIEEQKSRINILEAKNVRLATENNKLNEAVGVYKAETTKLNEALEASKKAKLVTEKKETIEKARIAEGRGEVVEKSKLIVIAETNNSKEVVAETTEKTDRPKTMESGWKYLVENGSNR